MTNLGGLLKFKYLGLRSTSSRDDMHLPTPKSIYSVGQDWILISFPNNTITNTWSYAAEFKTSTKPSLAHQPPPTEGLAWETSRKPPFQFNENFKLNI